MLGSEANQAGGATAGEKGIPEKSRNSLGACGLGAED